MNREDKRLSFLMTTAVGAAFILLTAAAVWFYRSEKQSIRTTALAQLTTIGELKANEISQWRASRLADAAFLLEEPFLVNGITRFLASPTEEIAEPIRNRFEGIRNYYHYDDVILVDPQGNCVLSLSGTATIDAEYASAQRQAMRSRRPVMTDIHFGGAKNELHLGVVAPLFIGQGAEESAVCSVVLVCNASRFLYPMLRSWPAPSKTSEITLSRIDGDEILFLNNLLYKPDSALKLRIPLERTEVPAVMAASGHEGIVQGRDYRGVEVLSYVCPVHDSPWFMVAKQDETEVFAEWHFRTRVFFVLFMALALAIFALAMALWQRGKNVHYRLRYDYEAKLRESLEKQSITLKSVGDAVMATDSQGLVDFLNPVAEKLTGWSHEEAQGQELGVVFHVVNELTRAEVESPVAKVLREGGIVGLANHTVLIARNGSERPIADSAAPIRDTEGKLLGVVLVFRDQTTEHNYKMLFHRMLDGFATHEIICDERGRPVDYRFLDVNPAFEKMTGLLGREIAGKTVLEVMPGTEQEWIDRYGKVALTGEPESFESYSGALDKYFTVTAFRPLQNQFATIFMDITAQRRMQQALQESEKRYRSLTDDVIDNAEVGTCILDAEFKIVWESKAMARYFGFDIDGVIGRENKQLILEKMSGIFEDSEHFVSKVFATYDDNTYHEKFVCHVMPGAGREDRWLQHSSQPILSGLFAGGRVEHYYDITALKVAEEKLTRQNNELRELNNDLATAVANNEMFAAAIEQSGDIVIITDADGMMKYVNKTFEKVTGYTRVEALGKNPRILKSGRQSDEFYREMWTTLKSGKPFYSRMVNTRKDGAYFIEDATLSPVMDATGRIVNYVGVKRDITERLQLEDNLAQTQKMETVGRLAGGVAHDFNNMLGVILGNAEQLLEKMQEKDPLREEAQIIITAAKRSAGITRQLLAFAKKQIIEPKILDMNEAIEGCLRMLRRLIGENIDLVWNPQSSSCTVKMDPVQIDQILTNLCVNARDAITDVGVITIKTSSARCTEEECADHHGCTPGEYVLLSVSDTGSGMSPEILDHIFEPFYTTKDVGSGTGLGLATVHGIVSQNGGFIQVESKLGSGTTFKIFLPAQKVQAVERPDQVKPAIPAGHGETILIAEDEPTLLKLSETMLKRLGYQVIAAATPAEALEFAKALKAGLDLLLSDVVMSGMNGKELAEKVRSHHPTAKVLFMSGYTADVIANHGILEKGVHFIQKPFTRDDIAVQVDKCLHDS